MSEEKRRILIDNTARNIEPVTKNIKYRHAAHCYLADQEYGMRFSEAANLDFEKVKTLAQLTNNELNQAPMNPDM